MNIPKGTGNYAINYYDKRVPEEDCPINVPVEIQESYERLDNFFERIFDENSLNVAKVFIILMIIFLTFTFENKIEFIHLAILKRRER